MFVKYSQIWFVVFYWIESWYICSPCFGKSFHAFFLLFIYLFNMAFQASSSWCLFLPSCSSLMYRLSLNNWLKRHFVLSSEEGCIVWLELNKFVWAEPLETDLPLILVKWWLCWFGWHTDVEERKRCSLKSYYVLWGSTRNLSSTFWPLILVEWCFCSTGCPLYLTHTFVEMFRKMVYLRPRMIRKWKSR